MNSTLREHERLVRIVAKQLEDEGYAVVQEPSPQQLPFSLGGYIPDLLATKSDDKLMVEIKLRGRSDQPERYRKVIDIVQAHPGWRFLIKTYADTPERDQLPGATTMNLDAIEAYLARAEKVASTAGAELAVPYLWNTLMALLRHKLSDPDLQRTGLSDRSLINQLYTLGELSFAEYERLVEWNGLRNRAVHDVGFSVATDEVAAMTKLATARLADLR